MKQISVLALQGSFFEHCKKLRELDAEPIEVRSLNDVENLACRSPTLHSYGDVAQAGLDGLIIPGGESTTLMKLLQSTSFR